MQKSSLQIRKAQKDLRFDSFTANSLKTLRKEKKLTLEKLASMTCLSPSYLSRLEAGTRRFNIDILQKLSHILECHPSDLIENKPKYQGLQKDFPIYGVQPGTKAIDFSVPKDLVARPDALSGVKTAFGIYINHPSYMPKYMPGEMIYIHPDRPLVQGCPALAISKDDKVIIGQFEEWAKNSLHLREFSGPRNVFTIPDSTLRIVCRIIGSFESV